MNCASSPSPRDYLRVSGGTPSFDTAQQFAWGLSPRERRNLKYASTDADGQRTISA